MTRTITAGELRARIVAAQGYASRSRRGRPAEVRAVIGWLGAVQLDSITTVDRAHRLTIGSRAGTYPPGTVPKLLRTGRIFEYWAHEACLLPSEAWPVYRRIMLDNPDHPWWGPVLRTESELADRILGEIRERGPLGSRHFEGERRSGMWGSKPAKRVLEALWSSGQLTVATRQGFQRLYDLPERVLPEEVLGAPLPDTDEALRWLICDAVRARGALTASGVVEHNRLRGGIARIRPHVDALIAAGRLEQLDVDDGGPPVLAVPGHEPDGGAAAVLLSPFDNLLWDRPFAERALGFRHLIEVYKRPHERVYGYYVLPFLHGTRIVARCDLKTDRAQGELRLVALHPESGVRWGSGRQEALERALERLASLVGAERVVRADLGAAASS